MLLKPDNIDAYKYYKEIEYFRVKGTLKNIMNGEKGFLIKANIPDNEKSYKNGSGEGVWVIMGLEFEKAYDNNIKGIYYGILDNDSVYYEGLNTGTKVPVEIIGEKRPVINYDWLIKNYKLS